MTPSKHYHHHNHHSDGYFATPPLPLLRTRRMRPPSLSLLQFDIKDRVGISRATDANTNENVNAAVSTLPQPPAAINTEGTSTSTESKVVNEDGTIISRNTSDCSRQSRRSRSNLLSDSEISVLDLGPSLSPEIDGVSMPTPSSSRDGSGAGSLRVPGTYAYRNEDIGGLQLPLRLRSCDGDGDGSVGNGEGATVDLERKKRQYNDADGRDWDYGYGHGIDGVGQYPVLVLAGDGMDGAHEIEQGYGHAHGQRHDHGSENKEVTISSPLLEPLKTTRKAKRGASWSRAYGV